MINQGQVLARKAENKKRRSKFFTSCFPTTQQLRLHSKLLDSILQTEHLNREETGGGFTAGLLKMKTVGSLVLAVCLFKAVVVQSQENTAVTLVTLIANIFNDLLTCGSLSDFTANQTAELEQVLDIVQTVGRCPLSELESCEATLAPSLRNPRCGTLNLPSNAELFAGLCNNISVPSASCPCYEVLGLKTFVFLESIDYYEAFQQCLFDVEATTQGVSNCTRMADILELQLTALSSIYGTGNYTCEAVVNVQAGLIGASGVCNYNSTCDPLTALPTAAPSSSSARIAIREFVALFTLFILTLYV